MRRKCIRGRWLKERTTGSRDLPDLRRLPSKSCLFKSDSVEPMAAAAMARSLLLALSCASCAAADAQLRGTNQTLGSLAGASRTISKHVLYDKLMGYWVGQLVGNFMGLPLGACETAMLLLMHSWTHETMKLELKIQDPKIPRPFEFLYTDSPMPIEPQTYYDQHAAHSSGLRCNSDGRGSIPQRLNQLQGAYTDAAWLTLHTRVAEALVAGGAHSATQTCNLKKSQHHQEWAATH